MPLPDPKPDPNTLKAPEKTPAAPLGPPTVKVGDMVLFTLAPASNLGQTTPQDRPAIVLEILPSGLLELQVFLKPHEAPHGRTQAHMASVGWSAEAKTGCWRLA
jgi:hypothetical protein